MNEDTVQQDMEKQTDLPDEMPYIRVGTSYYKIVYAPGLDGNLMRQRIP